MKSENNEEKLRESENLENSENLEISEDLNYKKSESYQLKKFKLWTKSLAIISVILLAACAFLIVGAVLLVQKEDEILRENDDLKAKISAQNSANSGENSATAQENAPNPDEYLIENLDTTKLLAQNDVGENQIPDHFTGNKNAKLIVIEYEDFACSHCQALHAAAQKIHGDYAEKVLFIHRAFNLTFPNSEITLAAAEAAYLTGGENAYWQMANLLYGDSTWLGDAVANPEEKLKNYAREIGLDAEKFAENLQNRAENGILTKLSRDKAAGVKAGVSGTPTWFVGGVSTPGVDAKIRAAIEKAL